MADNLTVIEEKHYEELLDIVDKGVKTFYEVGMALMQIRENGYYRKTHKTFEALCQDRWGFTSNYAKRLIRSSQVAENIKTVPIGTLPESEGAIRPLTSIKDPEEQREVYKEAVATAPEGKVTAKHIQEVIDNKGEQQSMPKEEESYRLFNLKELWRKASKKDKKKFLEWVEKHK